MKTPIASASLHYCTIKGSLSVSSFFHAEDEGQWERKRKRKRKRERKRERERERKRERERSLTSVVSLGRNLPHVPDVS